MHQTGRYKLYTRQKPGDSWTERPQLRMAADTPVITRAAGQPTVVRLAQTYGPGSEAAPYVNWTNHWLRITFTPSGGAESDIFYGHLSDQTLHEARREVTWGAPSIEAQLRNVILSEGYAQAVAAAGDCEEITLRPFNQNLDPETPIGWRGSTEYHFTRDSTFKTKATGGSTLDRAHVYGLTSPWDAWQTIRTLLRTHCPIGGGRHCAIGFEPVATTAAQTALEAVIERWDFLGVDAWTMLTRLVRSAGDLDWTVDWSTSGDYGYDFPRIRIFSRLHADRDTGWQTVHDVKGGGTLPIEALSGRVSITVKDRVTSVTAIGAPIKVQFTTHYSDEVRPMYRRGWTDADETAWAALVDSKDPEAAKLQHVWRRLYLPHDQTSIGLTTWNVFPQPDPGDFFSAVGDKVPAESTFGKGFYNQPRRILRQNLTQQAYTYTSQTGSSALSRSSAGAVGAAGFHGILCWFQWTNPPSYVRRFRVEPVQPLKNECGVMLPAMFDDMPLDEFAAWQPDGQPAWHYFTITLSIETDVRLAWTAGETYDLGDGSGIEDHQRRTLVVEVPDAEWWVALADTVIDVQADGTETTVHGVLRNDLPKLKDIAEKTLARYNRRSWHADIEQVDVTPAVAIGHFVGTYGAFTLNSPILGLEHHLGLEAVGTKLITGRTRIGGRRL